jgi:K+-sensing histidine kinase KdpD
MMIYGDSERLYQALNNVVANAIKYTPDKGTITIDGRMLPGFIESPVKDTGIGISPENQSLIFDKFGQLGGPICTPAARPNSRAADPGLVSPSPAVSSKRMAARSGSNLQGYDEVKLPGSTFHILLPTRTEPNNPVMIKFFGNNDSKNRNGNQVAKKIPQPTTPPRERAFLAGVELHDKNNPFP